MAHLLFATRPILLRFPLLDALLVPEDSFSKLAVSRFYSSRLAPRPKELGLLVGVRRAAAEVASYDAFALIIA